MDDDNIHSHPKGGDFTDHNVDREMQRLHGFHTPHGYNTPGFRLAARQDYIVDTRIIDHPDDTHDLNFEETVPAKEEPAARIKAEGFAERILREREEAEKQQLAGTLPSPT